MAPGNAREQPTRRDESPATARSRANHTRITPSTRPSPTYAPRRRSGRRYVPRMMREKPSGECTHSGETGDLVAKALGWDDGDILGDALVGVEVEGQARVVLLDDDAGRLRIEEGGDATSERDCGITTRVFTAGPVVPSPRAGKPTPGDGRREDRVVIHGIRTFLTVLVRTRPMLAT